MPRKTVSPAQAAEWLEKSSNQNRPISEATVKRYAVDMQNGKWAYDGETIIFDTEGNLLNGHHRLRACVLAEVPFETEIVTGINPDAFTKIDTGKNRNASDRMAIRGEANYRLLGPAVAWISKLQDPRFAFGGKYRVTAEMEDETLARYPEIRGSVDFINGTKFFKNVIKNVPMMAALHTLFGRHDEKARDKFFVALREGVALKTGSAALVLRDRLISEGATSRSTMMKKAYIAGLAIKAFNNFAYDMSLTSLRLAPGEDFPTIGVKPTASVRYKRKLTARAEKAREARA